MENNKDQKLGLWIFLITVIIVITGFSMNIYYEKRLANDAHAIVCVKIKNVYFRRGGIFLDFEYLFNNIIYHTGSFKEVSISKESYHQYNDGKHNILILILNKSPKIFTILENKDDFEKYHIIPLNTVDIKCVNLIFNAAILERGPVPIPPGYKEDTVK